MSHFLPDSVLQSKIKRISFDDPDETENELVNLAMIKRR